MNDEHDNAHTDKEMLAKSMFPREYAAIDDDNPMDPDKVALVNAEAERRDIAHRYPGIGMSGREADALFEAVAEGSYDPATDKLSMRPVGVGRYVVIYTGMDNDEAAKAIIGTFGLERAIDIIDILDEQTANLMATDNDGKLLSDDHRPGL